jgi:hypothetical protein
MKKRYSYKQLSSLWESHRSSSQSSSRIPLSYGSDGVLFKKAMDDICLEADLAETLEEYSLTICQGMKRLIELGVEPQEIQKHHHLIGKILYLGKNLLDGTKRHSEIFYLGIMVDLKIVTRWFDKTFYTFIIKAIKHIVKNIAFISAELKIKLTQSFAKENHELYKFYFPGHKLSG